MISKLVETYLPALVEEKVPVAMSRLYWYTDFFDNHYLIDRVPGVEGLVCVTGGSGHAFKYLPNIGKWVVSILEGRDQDEPLVNAWKWRLLKEGQTPVNQLMLGRMEDRTPDNTKLISMEDDGLSHGLSRHTLG